MKNFKDRVVLVLREILNILFNVLVPILSLLVLILELIPGIPMKWIDGMKKLEYYAFEYAGTAKKITEKLEEKYKKLEEKEKNK